MEREISLYDESDLRNNMFLFIGETSRGKRIQEIVKPHGWKIRIETELGLSPSKRGGGHLPDLVILDDFPDSKIALSAYYQLQHFNDVLFLALNDSPNVMKFSHVNRLSFLKIINSDSKPLVLINAIVDLFESNGKLPSCSILKFKN